MSSSSHRLIIAITLSFLYQLGHQSALALTGAKVLCIVYEPNKQFALIVGSPKKILAGQHISGSGGDRARRVSLHSIKESHWRSHEESGERDSWLNMTWHDSQDVNIIFNHLPYYSMTRDDSRIVTNKRWAW